MRYSRKINHLVESKETGTKWFCFQVPEELHYWTNERKFPQDAFEKYNAQPMYLKVSGHSRGAKNIIFHYTKKEPIRLSCGIKLTGQRTIPQGQRVTFNFRIDSTEEVNMVLSEIAKEHDVDVFVIKELHVHNKKTGAILYCERHNPDTNGDSLYIVGFNVDGKLKLYPDIAIGTMMDAVGKFKQMVAHCSTVTGKAKTCAIKSKVKSDQIKKRSKAA